MKANESITYNYTGKCQKITLEPGTYRFECYGGKGGGSNGANGDKTVGYYKIDTITNFYLWIGGQTTTNTGGWNGGATVTESDVYGGGGATDISLNGNDGSTIWNDSTHLDSIIIQAKGGQGQGKSGGATTGTYSNTRIDARTTYINRYGVHAAYIIPKVSGQLIFQSTNYSHDPYGFVDNANDICIASDDDSGRSYTGHSWDFRIVMNVTAGTMYKLRVGSYASSLGTTGWATWFATFPDSKVVLYTVVTSGGNGGGSNYFANTIKDTSQTQYSNNGNGKIIITRIGRQIITKNCSTDITSVIGGDTVTLTVSKTMLIDGYPHGFTRFYISYNKIEITKQNNKYIFVVPLEMDTELPYKEPLTIEAIFEKLRTNSNLYKDSIPYDILDFTQFLS